LALCGNARHPDLAVRGCNRTLKDIRQAGDLRVVPAATLIALHHLGLNFVAPAAVYPGGSNFFRVVVHAITVVVETAMLIFIGHAIRMAFATAQEARAAAEVAAAELEKVTIRQTDDLAKTNTRADRTGELLERFKLEMAGSVG